ncbi:MAG: hypothetical protein M0R33_11970 [Methylomonas sp.]|jgi:hypothetical protein|uniref:hypothetical protein n=1 Tax=Methylomonas sp. TaxID=418 RepID=UPI0025D6BE31|nr:hypothetical protein [Methylomonas sp.]MCK9607153.1 hypothetical protein [Methylomonas sp.]
MKRISKTLLMSVAVFSNNVSCGKANTSDIAQQQLYSNKAGTQIRLLEYHGNCQAISLTEDGTIVRYALDMPAPCHFHTDKMGNIRTLDESGYVYILIESSKQMPRQHSDCETHLQSIRIKGTLVEISKHKERVASCPPFQWDAFMFTELFD